MPKLAVVVDVNRDTATQEEPPTSENWAYATNTVAIILFGTKREDDWNIQIYESASGADHTLESVLFFALYLGSVFSLSYTILNNYPQIKVETFSSAIC